MDNIKTIFVDLYGDQLKKPHTTIVECHFDDYFDQQIRELERTGPNRISLTADSDVFHDETESELLADESPPPIPGLLSGGEHL